MKTNCNYGNKVLRLALEALGRQVARRPSLFIITSCIVTIILGMGFTVSEYEQLSPDYVTIKNGKFDTSRKMILSLFPSNVSKEFNAARLARAIDGPIIYITHKNKSGMISKSVFRDIQRLDEIVSNVTIETDKGAMKYSNVCAIEYGSCFVNPIVKVTQRVDDIIAGKYRLQYPATVNKLPKIEVLPFALNLGGVKMDEEGYVQDFMALRLFYYVDSNGPGEKGYMRKWESAVTHRVQEEVFESIHVYVAVFGNVADDINDSNRNLLPLAIVVALAVILFSVLALITDSWIRSKPWLGLAAVLSAGLAIISAYGTMFYTGVHNTDLTLIVTFMVLGTEIDDAFIMVASWRCTDPNDGVEKRVVETYSEAAVSVTISSLTSFVAYCVGIAAPIAIVSSICLQCAVCILFTYLYQLVFFGPIMALDGYREKSQRNAFIFCKTSDEGKRNESDVAVVDIDKSSETIMKCMRDYFGGCLQLQVSKTICLLLFAGNIITACFLVVQLKKGSQFSDVLREGSQMERAMSIQFKHFREAQHPINIIISQPLNYWDRSVQNSISNMLKSFEDHPYIANSNFTVSWLKYYKKFLDLLKAGEKPEDFLKLLRFLLRRPLFRQFSDDVNFNDNYTEITSTRYIVFSSNLTSLDEEVRLMNDVEKISEKSEIPIKIFSVLFIEGEQASVIGKITEQTIWITTLLMFTMFLVFVANFPHAVLVALCVTSSMVGTIGFMSAWGIRLDVISLIVVVSCLGFSINYSAHMSYSFATSQADTPNEKIQESIYRVGLPVIQGALSTIIAVIILAFQDIYVHVACFKVIFLTVLETTLHALFVLPVLLSLFDSCTMFTSKWKVQSGKNFPVEMRTM